MSFWGSLSKLGHLVEKKVEQTVKHVANDVKKVEKTIRQAVQHVEKKVEPVGKQVVKDTVHISQKAKEAFHQAEKKAEQMGKHVAHEVKQAEKAIQNVEKKVEHVAKQAVRDTVQISQKAQKAFHEAEKKTEQAIKHVAHNVKQAVSEALHPIEHKIKKEIKDTEKTIERSAHQLEKKAEHAAKQVVHDIINAGQNAERTVRQVGKNIEKSVHEFSKHRLESTMEFARGAGDAALADVTFNFVQQRSYNSKHPVAYEAGQMVGHAVWTIGGIKVTEISSAIGVGGAAVSLSGGGAFAGVPAMAAGAAGMTVGGVMMKTGITNFSKSASDLSQQLSRSEGVSGKAVKGTGNSLPSYGQKSVPMDPYREVYGFPVKVKPGAQEKHIPNTPNYKQEIANGKNKSIFYGDNRTAQELLDKFAGKGELLSNGKRERVDFGKPIGKYYDIKTGNYIETTRGIIHYGKDGAHIVPSEPLKK